MAESSGSSAIAAKLGLGGKAANKGQSGASPDDKEPTPAPAILTTNRDLDELYILGDVLGSGAFSVVKLGTHKITGNRFAVKIIDKRKGKMTAENLEKEISIFKKVDHRHIVRFQELYENDNKIYIVTELLTGGEMLDRIINRGNFSEKDAARVALQLVDAIDYLHQRGIVHRDLKPENILLADRSEKADIKISDFGLSALATKDAAGADFLMKTACGTLHYCAPEVLLRKGYDHRVDLWSLGVVLYVTLSGCFPFDGEGSDLARQIVKGHFVFYPQLFSHISDLAQDLISRCLTVDPDKRITAAQIREHPWITGRASSKVIDTSVIKSIRRFNARRKFKRAIKAVLTINMLKRALGPNAPIKPGF